MRVVIQDEDSNRFEDVIGPAVAWVVDDRHGRAIVVPDVDVQGEVWQALVGVAPAELREAYGERLGALLNRHVLLPAQLIAINRGRGARWQPSVWIVDADRVILQLLRMERRRLATMSFDGLMRLEECDPPARTPVQP